jgi:CHAT domain-containing protein
LVPGSSLVIELDGSLVGLAVEALFSPNGIYLSERFPITISPGLYFTDAREQEPTVSRQAKALVVGVSAPGFRSHEEAGSRIQQEAETVAAGFDSPILPEGKGATGGGVLKHLPWAAVFHFAGHGVASSEHSGVMLSDQLLTSDQLEGVNLARVQLVFLAACDTEKGGTLARIVTDSRISNSILVGTRDHILKSV